MKKICSSWFRIFTSLALAGLVCKITAGTCPALKNPIEIGSINPESKDPVDQAILDFSPVVYLSKKTGVLYGDYHEEYLPMTVESYIAHPDTQVLYDHKKKTVVIPKGKVTMEALANSMETLAKIVPDFKNPGANFFLSGADCINGGDNKDTIYKTPQEKTFKARIPKNINTPYYAIFSQTDSGHDYIQYLFFYGYNGDYPIVTGFPGAGAHKMDLEHLILEFEGGSIKKGSPVLTRVGFPTHGKGEAKWLDMKNDQHFKDLTFEMVNEKRHIVGYAAYHGHGMYPQIGTYVRLGGFGNDITAKGMRWFPNGIIRLERADNTNFFTPTMGWVKANMDMGPDGVGGIPEKAWFGAVENEDAGMDYKKMYCKNSDTFCITKKRISSESLSIPSSLKGIYENNAVFNPSALPSEEIQVNKDTTLYFRKIGVKREIPTEKSGNKNIKKQHITVNKLKMEIDGDAQLEDDDDMYSVTFNKTGKVHLTFLEDEEIIDTERQGEDLADTAPETKNSEKNLPTISVSVSVL